MRVFIVKMLSGRKVFLGSCMLKGSWAFLLLKCHLGEKSGWGVACQRVIGCLWSLSYSVFHDIFAK